MVVVDIEGRLRYLDSLIESSKYGKQKKSLQNELSYFFSTYLDKSMDNVSPEDICRFLVYKDKGGKTPVHLVDCIFLGSSGGNCACPRRLAVGSVLSNIGKLRAVFVSLGKTGYWEENKNLGNPVNSAVVDAYVKALKKEQALSHVPVKQAVPLFFGKLQKISDYILACLDKPNLKMADKFIFLRDRAFFLSQFFAGDRANDLGQVLGQEVRSLKDDLLFKHTVGKTLSNGKVNTFAIKSLTNKSCCPVQALMQYVEGARSMGIDKSIGYLFRPCNKNKTQILEECLSYSVVYERLKMYLKALDLDEGETPHSLRRGCALTLTLSGTASDAGRIMGHVGWFSKKSLDHYCEMSNIVDSSSVASLFAAVSDSDFGVEDLYKKVGGPENLPRAFCS